MDSSLRNCIIENGFSLWNWYFFHSYDLVLISEFSKRSKLYHFNVLKSSFCFIMNIWKKFKSSVSVFKPSQCSRCCRGAIYCFSLTSKSMIYLDLWKRQFFQGYLAAQWPTLGHCWQQTFFFFLVLLNVVFISFIF